ncbi:MAG: hypothetical protein KAI50_12215 [Desulfobacterales bacterium]|nr:hypothetical protein [Desulfobacterales bacterium]
MPSENAYKELEKRLNDLETNYKVAIRSGKISVAILIALLAVFFGITYKQIGEVADKAIKSSTIEKVIETAKSKAENEAQIAARYIKEIVKDVRNKTSSASD